MEVETRSASELSTDEDEVEPKFKYCRMMNHLQKIVSEDAISCINVASRFMCIGTLWGRIYLLDHQGNEVETSTSFPNHMISINSISVDSKGEFIASCSDDGMIHINGLYTNDSNQHLNLGVAIKYVELDPFHYKAGSGRRFILGDKHLTLFEKSFLKSLKSTVLSESEGDVAAIKWNNNFVAWASSNLGVRVYDLNERCSLGLLKWEEPTKGTLSNYRCNLRWCNSTTLLIGWVDTIRICFIRKRNSVEVSTRNVPGFIVDPISSFKTDFIVCGLAPMESLGSHQLVVLGYTKKQPGEKASRPVLCALEYKSNDYTEICIDTLSIKGYENYSHMDYHLDYLEEENQYFIVSPKDIVVASLYEADDRVQWLIEHGKFEEAMQVITQYGGKYTTTSVARLYLDHLLSQQKFDEAAKLCLRTFGNDKKLWEEEVFKFVKVKQLRAVSAFLPRTNDCKLSPHVYEMVLYEYLQLDPVGFLNILKEWQSSLYNSAAVINAIHDHFDRKYQNILLEALAILYSHEKEYDKAVAMYLKLQHKDVFELIRKHDLYGVIKNMILKLIQLDSDKAITLFLERDKIPPEIVVEQLEQSPEYLYMFLDAFDKVDSSGKFHWKMVGLYAKFAPDKLLPFLKRSNSYPIQQAYDICKARSFYPEMVYLLGRMGSTKEALTIILHKLNDINFAIEFCKEHNDIDLWTDLIDTSIDDPERMTILLDNIVGYVNPILLVNKIKEGKHLPGLKSALIKMLSQYNLQVSVQEGCNKILVTDYFNLHERTVKLQQQAIYVSMDNSCRLCGRDIISKDFVRGDIVVFNCRHFVHETCMPSKMDEYDHCIVCKSERNTTMKAGLKQ